MAHGPSKSSYPVEGNQGPLPEFILCALAIPRCSDLDSPHSYFQHYSFLCSAGL